MVMEIDLSEGVGSWRVTLPGLTEHMQTIEPRSKISLNVFDWLTLSEWTGRSETRAWIKQPSESPVWRNWEDPPSYVKFCFCVKNPEL